MCRLNCRLSEPRLTKFYFKSALLGGVEMKYKGIVLRLTKNKAIVTTDDFQCFYIDKKPTTYVGKQIEFSQEEIINTRSVLTKLMISVACILFIITCYLGITNMSSETKVFAYVDVDINPSLEIGIDQSGNVLRLVPLNKDAAALVDKLTPDKLSLLETVDIIIAKVKKSSALSGTEKDYVLISSTLNNKKDDKEYQVKKEKLDTLMSSLKNKIQENEDARVFLLESSINERKGARSEGISTGRYVLYNKYRNLKKDFSIEDAKTVSVNELIKGVLKVETTAQIPATTKIATSTPTSISIPTPALTPAVAPAPASTLTLTSAPSITPRSALTFTPIATPIATSKSESTPTTTNKIIYSPFMRFESYNYSGQYIRHQLFEARISPNVEPLEDSIFKIVPGLADPKCISFESKNFPGYYLKHENFKIILKQFDGSATFYEDATFRKVPGLADENLMSFQSFNHPNRYIRHRLFYLWIEEITTDIERKDSTYFGVKVW